MQIFEAEIKKEERGRLTFVELPFNAKELFCKPKGAIYVTGTINDEIYRCKLLSRGGGKYILVLDKALQKSVGFQGETMMARVTMVADEVNVQRDTIGEFEAVSCDMDVMTAIKSRHSIRKFTSHPISDSMLNTILSTGLQAPTAKNKRPYHFIVIKSRQILSELAHGNSNAKMLEGATCGIVVCGDRNIEGVKEFLYADCAAATQNMLLCIHALGLGGVWCGVMANSDWRKLIVTKLELPLKLEPISVIALGYSNEVKEPEGRWESKKIHYDRW